MAGHFPFTGKGMRYGMGRMSVTAFFEKHGLNMELQEKYYKWWYDWAKSFVNNDAGLKAAKGIAFEHYPLGQHSHHSFHLVEKQWATIMCDLGDLIRETIMPKMSADQLKALEDDHHKLVHDLEKQAEGNPREPAPDVGYFRHI